jgi:hypothetical protein
MQEVLSSASETRRLTESWRFQRFLAKTPVLAVEAVEGAGMEENGEILVSSLRA